MSNKEYAVISILAILGLIALLIITFSIMNKDNSLKLGHCYFIGDQYDGDYVFVKEVLTHNCYMMHMAKNPDYMDTFRCEGIDGKKIRETDCSFFKK